MVSIRELSDRVKATGPANHKIYEPSSVNNLPVIDNSNRYSSNVNTSIDCYVSGQYVTRKGKTIEVTQRYTLFISYNKETQSQTMKEAQERITLDFQAKYGNQFNISNIFVPVLPVPAEKVVEGVGKGGTEDAEFYMGSRLFKAMSAYEKQRYDIGTQRNIADKNINSIRQRYKLRRR